MIILDSETDPPVSKIATATLTLSATFFLIKKNVHLFYLYGADVYGGQRITCGQVLTFHVGSRDLI